MKKSILFLICLFLSMAAPVMAQSNMEVTDSTSGDWGDGKGGEIDPNHPAIKIIVKNSTRAYGEANSIFEFTTEGATLEGMPEIICEATAISPVGTYDIIVNQGTVMNYTVTYVKGTLTITKAPLTVTVQNSARDQGQENPEFVLTYEGWKNGEDESVLITKPVAATTATKDSPIGEYPIKVSGGEAQNYELKYVNGVLTVNEPSAIADIIASGDPFDVYTLKGYMVRHQVTSIEGLPKGVYVVAGKKMVVK